ncbi:hypothetical protein HMPREF1544_07613 [Mucor circinelloides 1006PhL]|uniref:Uncharacterized protein n=1 Tax=Mucor circinelloides f. circinelloides (strain 1006PhL) TaxID=1220926 RepID=S2K0F6_MUCC1|nr:hypothetical protein HMPREF1544_07613 [Mucor circinelloides 1006PhL]
MYTYIDSISTFTTVCNWHHCVLQKGLIFLPTGMILIFIAEGAHTLSIEK